MSGRWVVVVVTGEQSNFKSSQLGGEGGGVYAGGMGEMQEDDCDELLQEHNSGGCVLVNRDVYSTNDEIDRRGREKMEDGGGWLTPAGSRLQTCCGLASARQPGQQHIGQQRRPCGVLRR